MKPFAAVLGVALAIAALALVLDSPLLVLVSVGLLAIDIIGVLAVGLRSAQRGSFVKPFVAILVAALAITAGGVIAIVLGERGDAPGLVLLGIAVITSVVVGAVALGAPTARPSG